MSLRNVTSLGPNFGPFWHRQTKKKSLYSIQKPGNIYPILANLVQRRPIAPRTRALNTNGSNSLDARALVAGRPPAVQFQENELIQVARASLCCTVEPALAGSGHISPDDAFELKLFELELNIQQQAHFLADNYQGIVRKQWVSGCQRRFGRQIQISRCKASGFAAYKGYVG